MTETFPHLASPAWLLLLLALPLLAWNHHRRGALGALTYSRLPLEGKVRGAWRLHLPFYARLLALGCLVVALARPQLGYAWEESLTEGIDIEIVLDISGSMGAEDFQPKNRLTVAKQVVRDFVAGRPGDRVGFVVFAGAAMTRAPLTTDRQMLDLMIDAVELNTLPDGTAIGVAAAICDGLGIKVYTIGVGGATGRVPVPLPTVDPITGEKVMRRYMMDLPVDEPLLRQIAKRTGGQYYKATDREALERVFAEIDQLEKTPLQVKRYVRYQEVFPPLVWAGVGFLLLPFLTAGARVTAEP